MLISPHLVNAYIVKVRIAVCTRERFNNVPQLYYAKDTQTYQDALELLSLLERDAKDWAVEALNEQLEAAAPPADESKGRGV